MNTSLPIFGSAFAFAAGVAILLTVLLRKVAPRLGAVSVPKEDRWNRKVIPLLGGVAVWGGVTAALLQQWTVALSRDVLTVYGVATLLFGVGLLDDFVNFKPGTKLAAQIAAACVAVLGLGVPTWASLAGVIGVLLVIVWIVGITNAFNLLDNMDGVCAGIAVIAASSYALAIGPEYPAGALYGGALAGAAAGFLLFNFHPASIFMGDSGSLFIGASFGVLALAHDGGGQTQIGPAVAVPMLVLLLPIFDTVFVTLNRKLAARSASVGGRDHTSHRLVALGFSERQTALLLYALAAAGGGAAAAVRHAEPWGTPFSLLLLVTLLLLGVSLAKVRVYGGEDFSLLKDRAYTPLLLDVTYKRRIFEILLDVGLIVIAYFVAYLLRFDREFDANRALFLQSLPIVIACQLTGSLMSGLYRGVWRYISLTDIWTHARAVAFGTVLSVLSMLYLYRFEGYSRAVFAIYAMCIGMLLIGSRMSFRLLGELASRSRESPRRALVYGAGDAGALLVRELVNNRKYGYLPVGFIDDDPAKAQRMILGIRVLGSGAHLDAVLAEHRPDVLIVSTRKLPPGKLQALRATATEKGLLCLQFDFRLSVLSAPAQIRSIS